MSDDGIVRVWRVSIGDRTAASVAALLSHDERARAARYRFDRDRNQFVAVRGWLRRLLGEYLKREPADICFGLGPQGKPMVVDANVDLQFNVSHSGNVGLLAFCRGRDVGVDVERHDTRVEIAELAETCFSIAERESLRALPEGAQSARFFQLWAAKEACIKALGGGLSIPLLDFTVGVNDDTDGWTVEMTAAPGDRGALVVRRIDVPPGYAGAVAAPGDDWDVVVRDLE